MKTVLLVLTFAMLCSNAIWAEESSTPQQVFDGMKQSFKPDKAKGVHAKYQWNLSGPNGGEWWIEAYPSQVYFGVGTSRLARADVKSPICHDPSLGADSFG